MEMNEDFNDENTYDMFFTVTYCVKDSASLLVQMIVAPNKLPASQIILLRDIPYATSRYIHTSILWLLL